MANAALRSLVCPGDPPEQQHGGTKLYLSPWVALDMGPGIYQELQPPADLSKMRAVVV